MASPRENVHLWAGLLAAGSSEQTRSLPGGFSPGGPGAVSPGNSKGGAAGDGLAALAPHSPAETGALRTRAWTEGRPGQCRGGRRDAVKGTLHPAPGERWGGPQPSSQIGASSALDEPAPDTPCPLGSQDLGGLGSVQLAEQKAKPGRSRAARPVAGALPPHHLLTSLTPASPLRDPPTFPDAAVSSAVAPWPPASRGCAKAG